MRSSSISSRRGWGVGVGVRVGGVRGGVRAGGGVGYYS